MAGKTHMYFNVPNMVGRGDEKQKADASILAWKTYAYHRNPNISLLTIWPLIIVYSMNKVLSIP